MTDTTTEVHDALVAAGVKDTAAAAEITRGL